MGIPSFLGPSPTRIGLCALCATVVTSGRMATLRRAKAPQLLLPSMWGTLGLGTATEAMSLHGPLRQPLSAVDLMDHERIGAINVLCPLVDVEEVPQTTGS
jgi:hypothetical protein